MTTLNESPNIISMEIYGVGCQNVKYIEGHYKLISEKGRIGVLVYTAIIAFDILKPKFDSSSWNSKFPNFRSYFFKKLTICGNLRFSNIINNFLSCLWFLFLKKQYSGF
jgi:hypothetical protein